MEFCEKDVYDAKRDPVYGNPVIDCREQRIRKVEKKGFPKEIPYLYLHGSFVGTNVKFIFCFPEREYYEGRFFQHLSPFPGPDEELAALGKTGEDDFIAFALTHGGAYVESNMGSGEIFGSESDPEVFYRSSAATAEYCRTVARELFGEHRVYGYVFGGSGGGYKTMSCLENTNAFDGGVPFVIGSPVSLPNCLTVCANAGRRLRRVCRKISDALEPGGSQNIYEGLNDEERKALRELVRMGFPPRLCAALDGEDDGALPVLAPVVKRMDPEYFTDFWTQPGYPGADPNGSVARDRICIHTRITAAGLEEENAAGQSRGPLDGSAGDGGIADGRNGTDDAWQKMLCDGRGAYLEVEDAPAGEDRYLRGVDIIFESGEAKGKKLRLGSMEGKKLIPGMSYGCEQIEALLPLIQPGDEVFLDNSDYIALQTYHYHQVPEDRTFHAWDQFRDETGVPIYPQRPMVISYPFTYGGCGSVQDGKIQARTIVMNNLMDGDFPWQADWYRGKVQEIYGEKADQVFRLWYNDNCPHGDVSEVGDSLHLVSYLGMLRQALCDLARWVEKDEAPAETTGYRMEDNQVILSDRAKDRGGVQPVVRLFAKESGKKEKCVTVRCGDPVCFTAEVELPPGAGAFESADWSFEGEQDFPYREYEVVDRGARDGVGLMELRTEHAFARPGRYYGAVRVVSNRNHGDSYTRLRNLDRVCVVVRERETDGEGGEQNG